MREVREDLQALLDDRVRSTPFMFDDEADAAGIVLGGTSIEALALRALAQRPDLDRARPRSRGDLIWSKTIHRVPRLLAAARSDL
jgi:hypothetical protein